MTTHRTLVSFIMGDNTVLQIVCKQQRNNWTTRVEGTIILVKSMHCDSTMISQLDFGMITGCRRDKILVIGTGYRVVYHCSGP
jgi:hypothetical protein